MSYIKNVFIAVDQLAATLLGGYPDETISSWAYRMYLKGNRRGYLKVLIDGALGKDHCLHSFLSEVQRRQMPPELRS